jgi:hypothetical protein
MIASAGDFPVAAPYGRGGAIAVFNPGGIPYRTLAWSVLKGHRHGFGQQASIPDPDTINAPVVAANASGRFVIAWTHASSNNNPKISLRAATGNSARLSHPQLLASGSHPPESFVTAIDSRGDAIVMWNDFGSNGSVGLHAAIYHQ